MNAMGEILKDVKERSSKIRFASLNAAVEAGLWGIRHELALMY